MELLSIFSAFGLSFSAGLNAYIPLFVIGMVAHYKPDLLDLGKPYNVLADPWVLVLLGILIIIEFLADKIPAINHANDILQTFTRPLAGAIAFAATTGVITNLHPVIALACGLVVAGSVHVAKSAVVRPAVTATTGGAGNVPVSMLEDFVASVLSLLSVIIPIIIFATLAVIVILVVWWWFNRSRSAKAAKP